ncbi:MAG: RNA methyltransferase [Deltaproteobacteria bacterium]|jgi:tRNA G18 (ribose-2'-O)-methylase SpoU
MQTKDIVSRDNPTFRLFLRLGKTRGIKKEGLTILSGPKQVDEVLKSFPQHVEGVIFSTGHEPLSTSRVKDLPRYRLAPDLFRLLDLFDTRQPLLLLRPGPLPEFSPTRCPTGCTLCIPFQDPVNVGAVIRSAAAMGVSGIVALKEAAHPFHPKSLRGAGSTIFRVPVFQGPGIADLNTGGIPLITLSLEGGNLQAFKFPATFCLLPGLEGPGIPKTLTPHAQLTIPMATGVDSLNAAVATAIVLYAWNTAA